MSISFHLISRNGQRKRIQREKEKCDNKGEEDTKRRVLGEKSTNIYSSNSQSAGLFKRSKQSNRSSHISEQENLPPLRPENLEEKRISTVSDASCLFKRSKQSSRSSHISEQENPPPLRPENLEEKRISTVSDASCLKMDFKILEETPPQEIVSLVACSSSDVEHLDSLSFLRTSSVADAENRNFVCCENDNEMIECAPDETFPMTSCEDDESYAPASNEDSEEDEVEIQSVDSLEVPGLADQSFEVTEDSVQPVEEADPSVQSPAEAEHLADEEIQVLPKRWRVEGKLNSKMGRMKQKITAFCSNPALSDSERTEGVLRLWSSHCRMPFTKLDLLLHSLKTALPEHLYKLSMCGKTVMKTPKEKVETDDIPPGKYYHIGLVKILLLIISILPVTCQTLSLLFNVDGVKPFDSSALELYPILLSLPCIPFLKHKVFPIGVWCGKGKPKSPQLFFKRFEEELIALLKDGLTVNGKFYEIFLLGLACDAPCKCFLMGIKYFNGFSSCTRCVVHGETFGGTRVFLSSNSSRRTDKQFRDRSDIDYQPNDGREAVFLDVPGVDFASPVFILESMHLFFIGVASTLLESLSSSTAHKLDKYLRTLLINNLQNVQSWIPMEFSARRCQDFERVVWWKAVEFRLFLLYLGPVVLKCVLTDAKYEHFVRLHIAVRILHCPTLCNQRACREMARKLLREFVGETPSVYSKSMMTHNFHNLLHVVDDADYFVERIPNFSLSSISAFMFENYLQYLATLPESGHLCLEQIAKRLEEQFTNDHFKENYLTNAYSRDMMYDGLHREGPVPVFCSDPQYKRVVLPEFTVDVSREADNCVILSSGQIMVVENILRQKVSNDTPEFVIVGKIFLHLRPFYPQSVFSHDIGVFKGGKLSPERLVFPIRKMKAKCFRLPLDNEFVFFPLLHVLDT